MSLSCPALRRHAAALVLGLAGVPLAQAGGDRCQAGPESGWKPLAELVQKLSAEGWRLRKVEVDDGCFEVKGVDREGRHHEAYFHPVTLERRGWAH